MKKLLNFICDHGYDINVVSNIAGECAEITAPWSRFNVLVIREDEHTVELISGDEILKHAPAGTGDLFVKRLLDLRHRSTYRKVLDAVVKRLGQPEDEDQ